jgi:hypothetical protein
MTLTMAAPIPATAAGATATELASHNRPEILESIRTQFGQTMAAEDIADAIAYIVTRARHVTINEILIRPTEQERRPGVHSPTVRSACDRDCPDARRDGADGAAAPAGRHRAGRP